MNDAVSLRMKLCCRQPFFKALLFSHLRRVPFLDVESGAFWDQAASNEGRMFGSWLVKDGLLTSVFWVSIGTGKCDLFQQLVNGMNGCWLDPPAGETLTVRTRHGVLFFFSDFC